MEQQKFSELMKSLSDLTPEQRQGLANRLGLATISHSFKRRDGELVVIQHERSDIPGPMRGVVGKLSRIVHQMKQAMDPKNYTYGAEKLMPFLDEQQVPTKLCQDLYTPLDEFQKGLDEAMRNSRTENKRRFDDRRRNFNSKGQKQAA